MDLEIIHNAIKQTVIVIRYIRTVAAEFGLGIEINEFIPAVENQPYYEFPEIVDFNNQPLKWYWKNTANCAADLETIDPGNLFNSPVSSQFQLMSKADFKAELDQECPLASGEVYESKSDEEKREIVSRSILRGKLLGGLNTLGIGLTP